MTPELLQLATEIAVDSSWSLVESCSNAKTEVAMKPEDDIEWMSVGDQYLGQPMTDAFTLLTGLKLAEVHPAHPTWIREIAEL